MAKRRNIDPEYTFEGLGLDGKPILREGALSGIYPFPLRYATVFATSETAAKRIQTLWREANG